MPAKTMAMNELSTSNIPNNLPHILEQGQIGDDEEENSPTEDDEEGGGVVAGHALVLPPPHRSLLYRHRSPSSVGNGSAQHALLIREEINRIRQDITVQTRHAVPVPVNVRGSSSIRAKPANVKVEGEVSNVADGQVGTAANEPLSVRRNARKRCLVWKQALANYAKQSTPFRTCNSFATPYTLRVLGRDVIAGATVAVMEIPLSLSYAKLAGLPAYFGLYAAFVPPIVYPLFGTSRQLSVGPAALVSLIVSAGITNIVISEGLKDSDSEEYISRYTQLAIQCAFLSGLINVGMGLLRLGFITQFLSKALISGFTSGAAVLISFSQLKHLFGYNIPASNTIQDTIKYLVQDIEQFNWKTFVIGLVCMGILLLLKRMSSNESMLERCSSAKWLGALSPILVTIVMISFSYGLDMNSHGIPIVGYIPPGLPSVTISWWTPLCPDLVVVVMSAVIISFVQSIAVTKRIAYKRSYEVDSSLELIGIGFANLVGAMFQSYPTTGAIAQSAVADDVGAESGFASVITGFVVMIVLLLLTSVFEYMPLAVLAAIVIVFVSSMFDYKEAAYLFHVHFFDFVVWNCALFGTLFLGVTFGLVIAVALSLIFVIYESAYPQTAVLGRLPGTSLYHNVKQYPYVEKYDGVVIIRIDAPMWFANAQNVRDKVRQHKSNALAELKERNAGEVRYLILDLSPVSHIDTTALQIIEDMTMTQRKEGTHICFCNPGITVIERFSRSGIIDLVGREHFFSSTIDAVESCLTDMESSSL